MSVVSPQLIAAIHAVEAGVSADESSVGARAGARSAVGPIGAVGSAGDAVALLEAAERLSRLAAVARIDAIAEVDAARAFLEHGHTSAARMASHLGRCSSADSARADKIRRMVASCDLIEKVWRSGGLSIDQAAVLGRAFANPRVRERFIEKQQWFLDKASLSFPSFERRVADWVRLTDLDGPTPRPDPTHENRDASLLHEHFSGAWALRGSFGSLDGANNRRIFDAYLSAETLRDWDIARELHGDDACRSHLPRSAAQRRADALTQIFADAAASPARSVPIERVHNVVWSEHSLEAMMRRHFGSADDPEPVIDIDKHRCHTLDADALHPDAAFADFLVSSWRKVVTAIDGTCLDISAKQRFYVGLARLGIVITHDECFWPGCHVRATSCEIDHRKPAARGGLTTQQNGAPACHKHNRLKERGYTVTLTDDGEIQILTPTGDIIPR